MKEHIRKAAEWWQSLAARERQMVAIGGSVLALFLVYACIWSPLQNSVDTMRKRIVTQEKLLVWMRTADQEIKQKESSGQSGSQAVSPVVLLGLLQKQVEQRGLALYLTQMKQTSEAAVEMHFQKVDFDKLVGFLIAVAKEHHVSVTQMSASAGAAPGQVNADIVLKSG